MYDICGGKEYLLHHLMLRLVEIFQLPDFILDLIFRCL